MRAVNCWNCNDRIVLDDSFSGREIRCEKCSALVEVPEPEEDGAGTAPKESSRDNPSAAR